MSTLRTCQQWQLSDEKGELGKTRVLRLTESSRHRDRREYRRHDLEQQGITIDRWDIRAEGKLAFGRVVDLSAGGVRVRTRQPGIRPDQQIRVRLELPPFAGISPFIINRGGRPQPAREWVGWMTVIRVHPLGNGEFEVAAKLMDMEEIDRGMLGLYLSTQPLAA